MAKKNEVTDIKVNVKRTDRRSVYINGEYAFSISEGIFYDHGIQVGDYLTDEDIEILVALDEKEKVKSAALNLLSYRQRSVRELRNRLLRKGWSEDVIGAVLRELEEKGFLNDREFAHMLARDRARRKLLGPRAVKVELIKAGIESDIIEDVLTTTYARTPPDTLIQKLLHKRGIDLQQSLDRKTKSRIISLLKRKGYTWDEIEPVVSRLKTD